MARETEIQGKDAGKRIDRWFKDQFPGLAFGQLQKMFRKGEVRLNGKRVKGPERITVGDRVRVPPMPDNAHTPVKRDRKPAAAKLSADDIRELENWVLYRDNAVIVLNKPAGLATQGGSGQGGQHLDALLDGFDRIDDQRPRLVHRLDKDTSGVIVIARTREAASHLTKAFKDRSTDKRYWALVMGVPKQLDGRISLKMDKLPIQGQERMIVTDDGKPSTSDYAVMDRVGQRASLLVMKPLTGRTHQLRLHSATIGHPIVGDGKYGGKDAFLTGSVSRKLHLHSRRLQVKHPNGSLIDVTAPPPEHMKASFDALGIAWKELDDPLDDDGKPWS